MEYTSIQSMTVERMAEYLNYNAGMPCYSQSTLQSFEELAKQELAGNKEEIVNVYSCYGLVYHTSLANQGLTLGLTAQNNIISPWKKRFKDCTKVGVFYKKKLLWQVSKFEKGLQPQFLNKEELTKLLQKPFGEVELSLGELTWDGLKFIAWQFKNKEGKDFLIPWHNACLIQQTPEMTFVAKDFKDIINPYTILRFKEILAKKQYAVLLA